MLNFVCINAGNYLGRGKEYVEKLHDMVIRNLAAGIEGRFICFTDDEQPYADGIEKRLLHGKLKGWWNKLYLFKKGLFNDYDRIVFLDLDTVIVSGLDEIVKYKGDFAILRDFYRPDGLQSSVMMWRPCKKLDFVWRLFEHEKFPDIDGGDQAYMELYVKDPDILQDLYPNCFVSYKVHAQTHIPQNAKVVVFHGNPRPHAAHGWVDKVWKIGGGGSLEMDMQPNVAPDVMENNIKYCLSLGLPHLDKLKDLKFNNAVFVGGGPSLQHYGMMLANMDKTANDFVALNGSYMWLKERGVLAKYHVIADARPENADFIDLEADCQYLIASHCDKAVFDKLAGKNVLVWHRGHDGMQNLVDPDRTKYIAYISGGSTVGMVALSILYTLGYRNLHLFGYDSSYLGDQGHAYPQTLNDNDRVIDIEVHNRVFRAAPWMIAQSNEYTQLAPALIELGCEITTYGNGLLQHINQCMVNHDVPDDAICEKDGFWWPANDAECRASISNYIDDIDWIMGYCTKFDVAIQAGGNVGAWPKRLAQKFGTVYTFEPDNLNFQCLVRNCPEPNIVKMQAGLGESHAMISLKTLRHNCGAHFVDGNGIYPVFKIDDFKLPACDLIQLDIEGFEWFALKGGFITITNYKPVVVLEMKGLGEKFGYTDYDIEVFMGRLGYEITSRKNRDVLFTYKRSDQ